MCVRTRTMGREHKTRGPRNGPADAKNDGQKGRRGEGRLTGEVRDGRSLISMAVFSQRAPFHSPA